MSETCVLVLGAGSWGTALASLLSSNGHKTLLWSHSDEQIRALRKNGVNDRYLPGVPLPSSLHFTSDLTEADAARLLLFAVPSRAFRSVAARLQSAGVSPGTACVSGTKGIEFESGRTMTGILSEYFPGSPLGALSGPSHAEEVVRGLPTAVSIAARSMEEAGLFRDLFASPTFRAYSNDDLTGVELGGALKNIFAIAAGVCDGLGLGDNAKASLVTRSLSEMIRLGVPLGGRAVTFQGLSGIGDLMVTCFSRHSRNRNLGEKLGHGLDLASAEAEIGMVAEGVPTTRSAHALAKKLGIRTPIIDEMQAILFEGKPAKTALRDLLNRDPRHEQEF